MAFEPINLPTRFFLVGKLLVFTLITRTLKQISIARFIHSFVTNGEARKVYFLSSNDQSAFLVVEICLISSIKIPWCKRNASSSSELLALENSATLCSYLLTIKLNYLVTKCVRLDAN